MRVRWQTGRMADRSPRISDYGAIGDCRTMALVSREGSIDWWCQPRFDSPSIFARILDPKRGGSFGVEADGLRAAGRRYLPHTGVLETRLSARGGELTVTDFAALEARDAGGTPAPFARQKLVRLLRCTSGRVELVLRLRARPAYGTVTRPRLTLVGPPEARRRTLELHAAGRTIDLAATRDWDTIRAGDATLTLDLAAGDEVGVAVDYGPGDLAGEGIEHGDGHHSEPVTLDLLHDWLDGTVAFWERWAAMNTYDGPYRDLVERSAITLKLLTYHPSGAVVAAGTTSLPETIGGERNWDYRFTWLRDASFTLFSLNTIGYRAETDAFMRWLTRVCSDDPDPLVLYRVDGTTANRERTLPHLAGHRGSRPVRIGNGAAWQRQLDIYGEVLDAAYLDARGGGNVADDEWHLFAALADLALARWRRADTSIWEVRGGHRHFTYSKVMCWVALDRAIRVARILDREQGERERVARWRSEAAEIRRTVMRRGRRADGAFTQSFGTDVVDASALVFPLVGFIHGDAPSATATLHAVEAELSDASGLIQRYRADEEVEGVRGREGAFLICSFWLCDNFALRGELDRARARFEELTATANDLGLFSEEWDAVSGEMLGNVPQAFTHIGLISSAHNLQRAERHAIRGPVRQDAPRD
ncbi:MAG TPA: glycoside hydrolase family 15 protein [Candidatus Limnocylindria bacterium]|nr:glycoside hydrolase family 15 protein [Candidatus Limnocylindria bacterium]